MYQSYSYVRQQARVLPPLSEYTGDGRRTGCFHRQPAPLPQAPQKRGTTRPGPAERSLPDTGPARGSPPAQYNDEPSERRDNRRGPQAYDSGRRLPACLPPPPPRYPGAAAAAAAAGPAPAPLPALTPDPAPAGSASPALPWSESPHFRLPRNVSAAGQSRHAPPLLPSARARPAGRRGRRGRALPPRPPPSSPAGDVTGGGARRGGRWGRCWRPLRGRPWPSRTRGSGR